MIVPKHSRSDYDYVLTKIVGHDFLLIRDLNLGRMSVTNNIENIVAYIFDKHNLSGIERTLTLVVYRDSDGRWDGFNHVSGQFVLLQQVVKDAAGMIAENNYVKMSEVS